MRLGSPVRLNRHCFSNVRRYSMLRVLEAMTQRHEERDSRRRGQQHFVFDVINRGVGS